MRSLVAGAAPFVARSAPPGDDERNAAAHGARRFQSVAQLTGHATVRARDEER
jgi:hypothetical protein